MLMLIARRPFVALWIEHPIFRFKINAVDHISAVGGRSVSPTFSMPDERGSKCPAIRPILTTGIDAPKKYNSHLQKDTVSRSYQLKTQQNSRHSRRLKQNPSHYHVSS